MGYPIPLAVYTAGTGKRPTFVPSALLPTGVYRASTSRYCWCALTAPLHPYLCAECTIGGMFLWHSPHDRSHWALPSKFGLLGVRTFLRWSSLDLQLPPLLFPVLSVSNSQVPNSKCQASASRLLNQLRLEASNNPSSAKISSLRSSKD